MSISPFHGGLVFRDNLIDSSYPTQIEEARSAVSAIIQSANPASSGHVLNSGNLNEFFNPNLSSLSLDERVALCSSVGEDIV